MRLFYLFSTISEKTLGCKYMEEKNKGREFLFSKYFGFIDNEDEDGIIRRDSDGSIYYYGSDGSEGQIQPDGSGFFYEADGSEGHIYTNGSGYYYGADGSEEHIYSDVTGRFRGADGSTGHRNSDGSG